MGKVKDEIDCLKRLQELTNQLEDIIYFLKQEGLVDDNQIRSLKSSSDHPKEVQKLLKDLQQSGKLQLLEYRWIILPVETIQVQIITDRNQKEFAYNG